MPISQTALKAYASAQQSMQPAGVAKTRDITQDFASLLQSAAQQTVGSLQKSEHLSALAATGKADMTQVALAISKAELSLQSAITIRDEVIKAYKEVIRMPI